VRNFFRFLIALVLLAAAGGKVLDMEGFTLVLRGYRIFPVPLLWPIALAVTTVELSLAAWLLWGRALSRAALASVALHSFYGIWTAAILLSGKPVLNCGCFGAFLARPLTWQTVVEDLVMVAISFVLYRLSHWQEAASFRGTGQPSADGAAR